MTYSRYLAVSLQVIGRSLYTDIWIERMMYSSTNHDHNLINRHKTFRTECTENSSRRLDQIAQMEAANLEVMTAAYRVTGNYTIPGLANEVQQSKEILHKHKLAQMGNLMRLVPDSIRQSAQMENPEIQNQEESEVLNQQNSEVSPED